MKVWVLQDENEHIDGVFSNEDAAVARAEALYGKHWNIGNSVKEFNVETLG